MVPLGTYIGHHYTWRYAFALIAAIGLTTIVSLKFWMPALPVVRKGNLKEEMKFFTRPEAWLLIAITSIGTGGLFTWISYIAPLMTEITGFSANAVPYILILAGFGMLVGNFVGGKLADALPPATACVIILLCIALCLVADYFAAPYQILTLVMTFLTIQVLMIRTAKGAEMLGASASQASFNIGNALGALLGGLPIAAGLSLASPLFVGVLMALFGVIFTWMLIRLQKRQMIDTPVLA
jgi:DHA1 family arabinose polymer transporter-like MFS transporter